jgi:hypothetical protein
VKVPTKTTALGVLADVDEAAGAGQPRAELADVEVAFGVRLRQAQHRQVQPAAVVEVELVGWSMTACVLTAAPKFSPLAGMPPITPGSAVSVMRSITFSSAATARPRLRACRCPG